MDRRGGRKGAPSPLADRSRRAGNPERPHSHPQTHRGHRLVERASGMGRPRCGRFGLGRSREPQTLKELGVELGVTKERVRQLQLRAMNKLRTAARNANIPLPELQ